ncbi:MAG: alpha/beta hydrolase [Candidatus Saccharimonadales bacterium]
MQIVVNDLLTQYEKQGSGPVALFLHGWGDTTATFNSLVNELKADFTCISLDLPGFGGSQVPPSSWGLPDYAEFTQNFVEKLDLKPKVTFGHSNGGGILIYALAHQLVNPEKLILLASAGIRSEDSLKKVLYKVIAKIGKQFTKLLPRKTQQKLRTKLYQTAGSDILISPELEETFKKVVGYDVQNEAKQINQPTLLIYAKDDAATPVRYGETFKDLIKNSQLHVLPDGGHFVHQSKPTEVIKLMRDFLQ